VSTSHRLRVHRHSFSRGKSGIASPPHSLLLLHHRATDSSKYFEATVSSRPAEDQCINIHAAISYTVTRLAARS
jgi:hypothetical protein